MTVAKAFAAALTGPRRARRRPDARHPFGYSAELFYWSPLAALGILVAGGVLSVWEGIQRLLHASEVQASLVGFAVLGLGCLLAAQPSPRRASPVPNWSRKPRPY